METKSRIKRILGHLDCKNHETSNVASQSSRFKYTHDNANKVFTAEERQFYEENGYIVKKKLVTKEDIEMYLQRFDDLCAGKAKAGPMMMIMRDVALKGVDKTKGKNITKMQGFHDDPILRKYTRNKAMLKCVEAITGPSMNSVHTMLINKPPDNGTNSSRHPPHQDLWYFPFRPANKIVAAWTAMQKINDDNGCLYVVPGSHRRGILHDHTYPMTGGRVNKMYHQVKDFDLERANIQPLHMESGDTVFFHPLLYHGSGPNRSKGFRRAISCHYASEDCHFIDISDEHIQRKIRDEVTGVAARKKLRFSFNDIWRVKSRHITGNRYGFTRNKKGIETEHLDEPIEY